MKKSVYTNGIKTTYIVAGRIIVSRGVSGEDILLCDTPPQASLGNTGLCEIKEGGFAVLDFGCEICGGVEITFQAGGKKPMMRVVFGESVSEAMSELGVKNATNDHSPRDITFTAQNYSNMRVGYTGFRFVKIEVLKGTAFIAGIRAASEMRDIEYKGSFKSDDKLLDNIWQTGARTVHLNMQNFLWDGIKRDRLVWVGDMHPSVSTVLNVFGNNDVISKSLDLVKNIYAPSEWMNGIPSYSLWWLIIRADLYMYTGDKDYVKKDADYICALTRNILECIGDDGSDGFVSAIEHEDKHNLYTGYFVDWETFGTPGSKSGFYAVASMALYAAQILCEITGDTELSLKCAEKINIIKSFDFPATQNKQMAALCALADMRGAKETNSGVLSKQPHTDITAYLGYYVLLAKGKAGDIAGALDIIRGYWGRMIELGATSFWEAFDCNEAEGASRIDEIVPKGKKDIHGDFGEYCYKGFRRSLCHGWASGPTPFISRYVLGVEIKESGCKKVKVSPNLGGLKWIEGAYPTPYGNIEVFAENKNGVILKKINAPKEIEII